MKIIVFDDDPTGSQTVFNCTLLLEFSDKNLIRSLENPSDLLFLLTNTRALSPELAEEKTRKICRSLLKNLRVSEQRLEDIFFISRGDSTLRGHGILEPNILNQELGPFDATFHVPAFLEGGRTTVNGIHLLNELPVHKSIFAKDKIFGYSKSYLPDWIEEKSQGKIKSGMVKMVSIQTLNSAIQTKEGMNNLINFLYKLSSNQHVVVDAQLPIHLITFSDAIKSLYGKKRFLFRSAASLINALSSIPLNSNPIKEFSSLRLKGLNGKPLPGFILVGSHVQLADEQLGTLLQKKDYFHGIKLNVDQISKALDEKPLDLLLTDLERSWLKEINSALDNDITPVLYTSRQELTFLSSSLRMSFGLQLAEIMARLTGSISNRIGYIISKGGITSQILLSKGLNLELVHLIGQVMPGISMVSAFSSNTSGCLPVVTLPGNLGNKNTLFELWERMESR